MLSNVFWSIPCGLGFAYGLLILMMEYTQRCSATSICQSKRVDSLLKSMTPKHLLHSSELFLFQDYETFICF